MDSANSHSTSASPSKPQSSLQSTSLSRLRSEPTPHITGSSAVARTNTAKPDIVSPSPTPSVRNEMLNLKLILGRPLVTSKAAQPQSGSSRSRSAAPQPGAPLVSQTSQQTAPSSKGISPSAMSAPLGSHGGSKKTVTSTDGRGGGEALGTPVAVAKPVDGEVSARVGLPTDSAVPAEKLVKGHAVPARESKTIAAEKGSRDGNASCSTVPPASSGVEEKAEKQKKKKRGRAGNGQRQSVTSYRAKKRMKELLFVRSLPAGYCGGSLRPLAELRAAIKEKPLIRVGDRFYNRDFLERRIKEANEVIGKRVQSSNRVDVVNGSKVTIDGRKNAKYLTVICSSSGCTYRVKCAAELNEATEEVTWVIRGKATNVTKDSKSIDELDAPVRPKKGKSTSAGKSLNTRQDSSAAEPTDPETCLTHCCSSGFVKGGRKPCTNYSPAMLVTTFLNDCTNVTPTAQEVQDVLSKYTFLKMNHSLARRLAAKVAHPAHRR